MSFVPDLLFIYVVFMYFGKTQPLNHLNNACSNFPSYFNILFSKNCYYNPDIFQDVCNIAKRHIGTCEQHNVTTEDGYILGIFHLPRKNPKGTILLQHPLGCDGRIWFSQSNQSTAFIFWYAGYDVWIPNNRGSDYSKKHVNLTTNDPEFWNFSFHEMGVYDHKATVDYIRSKTNNSQIIFVTHSMSGTSALIYAALRPKEAQEKVKAMILAAPAAYMGNMKCPCKYVIYFFPLLKVFLRLTNQYSIGAYDSWPVRLGRNTAIASPFKMFFVYIMSFFSGPTPEEYDPNIFNNLISHITSEFAWKILFHYGQLYMVRDKFQMYDYGEKENLRIYGKDKPSQYPLDKINTTIYIINSKQDYFADVKDVDLLYNNLPENSKKYGRLVIEGLNHIDFHAGKDRIRKVYQKNLDFLEVL